MLLALGEYGHFHIRWEEVLFCGTIRFHSSYFFIVIWVKASALAQVRWTIYGYWKKWNFRSICALNSWNIRIMYLVSQSCYGTVEDCYTEVLSMIWRTCRRCYSIWCFSVHGLFFCNTLFLASNYFSWRKVEYFCRIKWEEFQVYQDSVSIWWTECFNV